MRRSQGSPSLHRESGGAEIRSVSSMYGRLVASYISSRHPRRQPNLRFIPSFRTMVALQVRSSLAAASACTGPGKVYWVLTADRDIYAARYNSGRIRTMYLLGWNSAGADTVDGCRRTGGSASSRRKEATCQIEFRNGTPCRRARGLGFLVF